MIFTILEASKAQVKTLQNHDVIRLMKIILKRVKRILSIYGFEHGPEVVTISAAEGTHYVPYDAEMQKRLPYYGGSYEACNIPFTDFQIRYQPEQIRIVDGKRILEDTAFLCRKDNDHFLILPSIYEKLDLDDWLLAHLFFYDKDGKRYIGVELSEVD